LLTEAQLGYPFAAGGERQKRVDWRPLKVRADFPEKSLKAKVYPRVYLD
jgi:hypothetical protein